MSPTATPSTTPLATVLLPVYNGEAYLAESLESLRRQTRVDFEILAIDDASTDRSPAILAEYARKDSRVRILTRPQNGGLIEALNLGLRSSTARYIVRHDADDRAHPERLQKSLDFLERHPKTVLLGSWISRMAEDGTPIGLQKLPNSDAEIRWQLLFRNPFAHSSVVFDRELALSVGGYSASSKHAEDYDLWLKLATIGDLAILPESLCDYRVHGASITNRHAIEMESLSAELGARWLTSLIGSKKEAGDAATSWKKFRNREPLDPYELNSLFSRLLELRKNHPSLTAYPVRKATADLAWHFLSYLKRRPEIAADVKTLIALARFLPSLIAWPGARWRTA